MRNIFPVALTLALAAVIGGVCGYVVVDKFVMRRPPEFAAWKEGRKGGGVATTGRDDTDVVNAGDRTTASRKDATGKLPRKHRWIAEAKVGPYRQQAMRVVEPHPVVSDPVIAPPVVRGEKRDPPARRLVLQNGPHRALRLVQLGTEPHRALVDEVEAALDEVNVDRFAQYIRRYSDDTQFILITHRRGTMNAADRLYGVTMPESGISKFISVDVRDIADKKGEFWDELS